MITFSFQVCNRSIDRHNSLNVHGKTELVSRGNEKRHIINRIPISKCAISKGGTNNCYYSGISIFNSLAINDGKFFF
jgi:hypothetical protein